MSLIIIRFGLMCLFLGLIYLLLRSKSPPKLALKTTNLVSSLIFVSIIYSLVETIKLQHFMITYKVYSCIGLLIFFVTIWVIFRWKHFFWLISGGMISNMVIFMANDWKMPVFLDWEKYYSKLPSTPDHFDNLHKVMTQETQLNLLGDWIYIKLSSPLFTVVASTFSPGDILTIVGGIMLSYKVISLLITKNTKKTV